MLTLMLKNIPEQLHAMKESAEKNRRSLNSEILARLERGDLAAPTVDPEAHAEELKAFIARLPRVEHARISRYKPQGRASPAKHKGAHRNTVVQNWATFFGA